MEANEFLANYWQKQPLLIPGALAELPALSADELAGLALETEIESRLILEHPSSSNWELHHGPFTEQRLQSLPNSHWTLLVQAVDQWLPDVHDLLESFNFLPRWRLDDIMVSCAADQGSVGPHFDSYNVFLLQTAGRKRWRIGQYCGADTELVVNSPLRLLSEFEQQEEYLLEPGDMLYLPPRIAHWGVSEGESMTFSIGFRSPTAVELLNDLATELLSEPEFASKVFNDPPLSTDLARGVIDPVFIEATRDLLISQLSDDALLARWFARFMTTRKYPDLELITDKHKLPWQLALARGEQLAWHPASR
ncbi:MAG: cupin domain-containing protein, partial [Gammaproteobacteria bacterium]